jgi:hypothetical protein
MPTLKTLTSAVTAVALVTGIGLAFAQSEDQPAAPKPALSEQTPADPSATTTAQPSDTAQQPADQAQTQSPPATDSSQQPAMPAQGDSYTKPATQDSMPAAPAAEPKPKADRN